MFFDKNKNEAMVASLSISPLHWSHSLTRWIILIASIILIFNTLGVAWRHFLPRKQSLNQSRASLVTKGTQSIIKDLKEHRGDIKTLAMVPFAYEPSDTLSDAIRNEINVSGLFDLCEKTFMNRMCDFFRVRQHSSDSLKSAVKLGLRKDADAVLYGAVRQFETFDGKSILIVDYHLVDPKTEVILHENTYDSTANAVTEETTSFADITTDLVTDSEGMYFKLHRLGSWLLITLLLPIFTINFLSIMTEKRSNLINAFILAIYTLIDIILAWLLVSPNHFSWGTMALFLILSIGAFFYNVQMMTVALRRVVP